MSESERHRRLPYTRVLIETERILDPQFNDSVVFLSGAQIEMCRNLTQYLRRRSTFCEDLDAVGYLTPSTEDWDSIQAIVSDLEEVLMGNPNTLWGFYEQYLSRITEESVGDPATYAETYPIPAGYVGVMEAISLYHTAGTTCAVHLIVNVGAANPILYSVPALPSAEYVCLATNVTLVEGQTIRLRVTALPSTKYAILRVLGYTMKVPE